MHFWSEGLGERHLEMNLGKSHVKRLDEFVLLSGVVDSPAPWEYEVKINREDWAKILQTAVTKEACGFIAAHTSFARLAGMAWSIAAFVALLAWFRAGRLLGLRGMKTDAPAAPAQPRPAAVPASNKN